VASESPTLVLFDVDGTLVRTEGASPHSRAFKAAFKSVYGQECRFTTGFHGMTDVQIFMTLAQDMGLAGSQAWEMAQEACRHMVALYLEPQEGDGHYVVLPGVEETIHALVGSETVLGLLTGNTPEIARHKLESVGLHGYFSFGAFGTEAWDRNGLPPIAVARAEARVGRSIDRRRVFVIGDTPRDVGCALENGYRGVAVATGNFSVETLLAAGAELVLPDLRENRPLLRLLGGGDQTDARQEDDVASGVRAPHPPIPQV